MHDIDKFLGWWHTVRGPKTGLDHLSAPDLGQYREQLVAVQHAKPATVKRKLESLRRLCRWAFHDKRLAHDVTQDMRPVRLARRAGPKSLSDVEVHALLRAAGASRNYVARRNYALAQLLLQAGLRVGEMSTMWVSDAKISSRSGMAWIRHGKGRKEQDVPLNASARRALQRYLEGRNAKPEDPLFVSSRGGAMSIRSVQDLIQNLGAPGWHSSDTREPPYLAPHVLGQLSQGPPWQTTRPGCPLGTRFPRYHGRLYAAIAR